MIKLLDEPTNPRVMLYKDDGPEFVWIHRRIYKDLKESGMNDDMHFFMGEKERFIRFCEWNGLINWGEILWELTQ